MKKRLIALFLVAAAAVCLLIGCGGNKPLILSSEYTIVYSADAGTAVQQAALSLQTTISQKTGLTVPAVTDDPGKETVIQVGINEELKAGAYRISMKGSSILIEAQSADALTIGMRKLKAAWMAEGINENGELTLTNTLCETLSGTVDLDNAPFLVMSQNIRYSSDPDGNSVIERGKRFNLLVQEYQPDILCTQESNKNWVPIYEAVLGDVYTLVGEYDAGYGVVGGNQVTILYRTDRYELVETETFWLTYTPEEFSKLEGSKSTRICTWALLKDKLTQQTLFVCNTHLDTLTDEVRVEQLNIILDRVADKFSQYPSFFTGDFNARPDSEVYAIVTKTMHDPQVSALVNSSTVEHTYDDYGTSDDPRRLDYCFYDDRSTALEYRILTDLYGGYVSDHYGIITEFVLNP